MQVFSTPLYDKTAKYILTEDEGLRIYILQALSGLKIKQATVLDDHLNPLDPYNNLRKLLNSPGAKKFFDSVKESPEKHGEFMQELSKYSGDLRSAFPLADRDSQIDFLCDTDEGYITLEIQLVRQDYWDARALAYAAALYGNQLKKGARWQNIKKIMSINLLGDGTMPYWKMQEYHRHYLFQNKFNGESIDYLQLQQYSLGDVDLDDPVLQANKPLHDTLRFFKSAADETEVPLDIDPDLKTGYELIRVDYLKKEHPEFLAQIQDVYANTTEHDQIVGEIAAQKATEKAKLEIARNMLDDIKDDQLIAKFSGLTLEEVQQLREGQQQP